MCNKVKVIVDDLKKTQGTDVTFNTVIIDAAAKEEIKETKLKSHGIIAKDKEGKVVELLSGHDYGKEAVSAIVTKLLTKK